MKKVPEADVEPRAVRPLVRGSSLCPFMLAVVLACFGTACGAVWGGGLRPRAEFMAGCDPFHATVKTRLVMRGVDEVVTIARAGGPTTDRLVVKGTFADRYQAGRRSHLGEEWSSSVAWRELRLSLRSAGVARTVRVAGNIEWRRHLRGEQEVVEPSWRLEVTTDDGAPGSITNEERTEAAFHVKLAGREYAILFQPLRREYILWAGDRVAGFAGISWRYWAFLGRRYDLYLRRDLDEETRRGTMLAFVVMKVLLDSM